MADIVVVCDADHPRVAVVHSALSESDPRVAGVASQRQTRQHREAVSSTTEWEQADLTDPDAVDALWERLDQLPGSVDAVVNVTGGFRAGTVAVSTAADVRFMLQLNLEATWWSCRASALRMSKRGRGSIVNVGSRSAMEGGQGS